MPHLQPEKLHVRYMEVKGNSAELLPRRYTLTHSDSTGDLFLSIGPEFDMEQISGLYTRFMRDEVLAEWLMVEGKPELHVYCHVSGGLVLGGADWRASIFEHHLPQVLQAFRYGDREHFSTYMELDQASIKVHFRARQARHKGVVDWGTCADYRIEQC